MSASTAYSLLTKKDNAHEDKIYCGLWAQITTENQQHNFIVTGGLDSVLKVWQLENNKITLIHTLMGHKMAISSIAASPDGHTIASISLDDTLIIWELLSGNKVHEMESGNAFWTSAFAPDGNFLAAAGHTGKVAIINVEKGMVVQSIDTRGKFILSVAWSRDGTWLATGAVDGTVHTFDMSRNGVHRHAIQAHRDSIRAVAFSPNSNLLATASNDGMVKIYNVKNIALKGTLEHKCCANSVCFSRDGTRIATAAADGRVRVARARRSDDNETGPTMTSISNGNVRTVEVSGQKNKSESSELEVLKVFSEHTDAAWGVQFSPDSTRLLSVSKEGSINIYECPLPPKKK